ncbi:MAG TPA: hypothetical protein VN915_12210 [Elusimicrobiota bacterium]|nr:hypothetical protein [Elusimicrobiota bacterium]
MPDLVLVDAWLLLGAVVQLALVLRARNFYPRDWILPLLGLLGGSLGWFGFLYLCSNAFGPVGPGVGPAANGFVVGFGMALAGSAIYVSAFAPMRLNPATLLSLTISFWAVYWTGGVPSRWLWAAVPMSAAALVFIAGGGRGFLTFRAVLQIWSLAAAALVAWDAIPAGVGSVLGDYRVEELAHTLGPVEVLVTGAQTFLFAQMAVGLVLLVNSETWTGWLPEKAEHDDLSWPVIAALIVQAGAFVWLRKSGAGVQSQFMAVAIFAALAHGAMTGPDAKGARPVVDVSFEPIRGPRD